MRRRVIGAALIIVGVMTVLLAPEHSDACGDCSNYGSSSLWNLMHWPQGWLWAFLPMVIIGVALVVSGIVLIGRVREFH